MINQILLFASSGLLLFWGTAHFFPTKSVIRGFGDISSDNRRLLAMEWINEGVTLVFIGVLVAAVALAGPALTVSRIVLWISIAALIVLSIVSLFTGFRIHFLPYRLCPVIFTAASLLILAAMYL